MHLATIQTEMAIWLQVQPKIILEVLHQVAKEAALLEFPEYENTYKDIFVRVESTVEENIRDLRWEIQPICTANKSSGWCPNACFPVVNMLQHHRYHVLQFYSLNDCQTCSLQAWHQQVP